MTTDFFTILADGRYGKFTTRGCVYVGKHWWSCDQRRSQEFDLGGYKC